MKYKVISYFIKHAIIQKDLSWLFQILSRIKKENTDYGQILK